MNYIKNGLYSTFVYGCGLIIVNGSSFLMLPFYTQHFTPSEYAVITLVLTFLPLSRYTLPVEISQAAAVFSSDYQSQSEQYVSIGFWFTILMNALCYLSLYIANMFFHFISYSSLWIISIFGLLIIDCLFYYSSMILRWTLKPILYNCIVSIVAIFEVILTVIFVAKWKLSILGVFYSWLICRTLGFLTIYLFTRNYYKLFFHFSMLKKMLSFSLPLMFSNIANNINRSFDRWIIATLIGSTAVGIYGAGATIGGLTSFVFASLSAALTPIIYKSHKEKDAPVYIVKLFYIVVTFCMCLAMIIAVFNKDILNILVSDVYRNNLLDHPILPIVVLTSIFSGLYIFAPGIIIKKKTRLVIWFNLISLLVNFILATFLIRKFGITGVAFATCASAFINLLIYIIASQKFYRLPFNTFYITLLVTTFTIFYLVGIWIGRQNTYFFNHNFLMQSTYCLLFFIMNSTILLLIIRNLNTNRQNPLEENYLLDSGA